MDWYLLSEKCTPLRNRNWRRDVFDSAVEALGLRITPHNLRAAASLAIKEGASVVAVARLLGHESVATTLNHYAGLFPTDLDDIASRLDAAARCKAPSNSRRELGGRYRQGEREKAPEGFDDPTVPG
jgi:integrase